MLIAAAERFGREPLLNGSDVIRATSEALEVTFAGGDPYSHFMASTVPPGSPFVYPPGELLWYLPAQLLAGDLARVDTIAGVLTTCAIAVAGVRVGFAAVALPAMLYASWGILAFRAVDGSNDVSAALLVVVALVLLAFVRPDRRAAFVLSAVALGWALAFKQFALLVLPPLVRHLAVAGLPWRRYLAIAIGVAAVMTLPFFLMDPGALVRSQLAALSFHTEVWGLNLAATLSPYVLVDPFLGPLAVLQVAVTALAAVTVARARVPTIGAAALAAAALITIPLLLARWTTQPYFVYVAAIALAGLALVRHPARGSPMTASPGPAVVGPFPRGPLA